MAGFYWCILQQDNVYTTWLLGRRRVSRDEVDQFSVELNHQDSLQAIFLDAVRNHGGVEADVAEYRMDVYELVDGQQGDLVIPSYRCSAEFDDDDSLDY